MYWKIYKEQREKEHREKKEKKSRIKCNLINEDLYIWFCTHRHTHTHTKHTIKLYWKSKICLVWYQLLALKIGCNFDNQFYTPVCTLCLSYVFYYMNIILLRFFVLKLRNGSFALLKTKVRTVQYTQRRNNGDGDISCMHEMCVLHTRMGMEQQAV